MDSTGGRPGVGYRQASTSERKVKSAAIVYNGNEIEFVIKTFEFEVFSSTHFTYFSHCN